MCVSMGDQMTGLYSLCHYLVPVSITMHGFRRVISLLSEDLDACLIVVDTFQFLSTSIQVPLGVLNKILL